MALACNHAIRINLQHTYTHLSLVFNSLDVMVYLETRTTATPSFDTQLTCVQHLAPDSAIPSTLLNVFELRFIKSPTLPPASLSFHSHSLSSSSLFSSQQHLFIRALVAALFVLIGVLSAGCDGGGGTHRSAACQRKQPLHMFVHAHKHDGGTHGLAHLNKTQTPMVNQYQGKVNIEKMQDMM